MFSLWDLANTWHFIQNLVLVKDVQTEVLSTPWCHLIKHISIFTVQNSECLKDGWGCNPTVLLGICNMHRKYDKLQLVRYLFHLKGKNHVYKLKTKFGLQELNSLKNFRLSVFCMQFVNLTYFFQLFFYYQQVQPYQDVDTTGSWWWSVSTPHLLS